MTTSDTRSVRRAGIIGTAGGALTALSGAAVATYVMPATDVPDTMWSYPWSSGALVPVSVAYAVLHGLVLVGLLGFGRSGVAGDGRAARLGVMAAVAGTAVLAVAEFLSIPIAGQRMDDTGPGLVGAVFGVGTVVSAVGFVAAGVATVRARRWDGWRRFTPPRRSPAAVRRSRRAARGPPRRASAGPWARCCTSGPTRATAGA
jgi:hypothetical protein